MEYKIADYFVPRAPLSFAAGWMEIARCYAKPSKNS